MKSILPLSSPTPVTLSLQAEMASQLRSTMIAVRDVLFELQEVTTRLGDVVGDLHDLIRKIDTLAGAPSANGGPR